MRMELYGLVLPQYHEVQFKCKSANGTNGIQEHEQTLASIKIQKGAHLYLFCWWSALNVLHAQCDRKVNFLSDIFLFF